MAHAQHILEQLSATTTISLPFLTCKDCGHKYCLTEFPNRERGEKHYRHHLERPAYCPFCGRQP